MLIKTFQSNLPLDNLFFIQFSVGSFPLSFCVRYSSRSFDAGEMSNAYEK